MTEFYPWLVLLHVVGAFGFVLSHGVSAYMAIALRRERDPARIRALLDLSSVSLGGMYGSLALLLIAGIAAGIVGGWFGRAWIWLALVTLVIVIVAMYAMASRYYGELRSAVGLPSYRDQKGGPPPAPASPETVAAMLASPIPGAILAVGLIGLLVILWLMVVKPF
jgi:hypothetical protein